METYRLTLLAPARDTEVARAAIQAGADAVYIGAPKFGARQAAGNSIEDLAELVIYAHQFGAQVLVTLNTLLTEEERKQAVELAWQLYRIGVDALIVQDLKLLGEAMPPIRLHASTQCDNRSAARVQELEKLGFKRVVLARELGVEEIKAIRQVTSVELEAFVHGALCVSYSGQCYMSERLLGRSANRGCCAQMCRMRYDLLDENHNEIMDDNGHPIHQRYLLSLQDMDRSRHLKEMIEAGVTTFKIEGRLKDKEYVTNIVSYYRQLLDAYTGQRRHQYARSFVPNPEKTFHRGGIDYFWHGRTPHMANWATPKSTGERVGVVLHNSRKAIRLLIDEGITLHNGDGLCYADKGFSINRIDGDTIYPNQPQETLTQGTVVYRNLDVMFLRSLQVERTIPLSLTLRETDRGFCLAVAAPDGHHAEKEFETAKQPANRPERATDTLRQQLSRLGDTSYFADHIHLEWSQPWFLPISEINRWRRELIDLLQATYTAAPAQGEYQPIPGLSNTDATDLPLMRCRYCILHEMGHCRKQNPMKVEPKYIRLANGTEMQLHFDCKQCEMRITEPIAYSI